MILGISRSQYKGTTKNTICIKCGIDLNNKTRLEQDEHEKNCKKQKTLI